MKWPKVTYCFDIDGVVCTVVGDNYRKAKPIQKNIDRINEIYWQKGTKVIFFTGRGTVTGKDWRRVTEEQFREWGVLYDDIIFGKPHYDLFVDDRALSDKQFFKNVSRYKRQTLDALASRQRIPGLLG